ncbi:MAG: Dabb family protein [Planctomycetales bacterium]|nr:Dabb family protein [Planctomycetales bacterium]
MLAHIVFFTLKDSSPAACQALVDACNKYLSEHPGTVHYSAGQRAVQYARPVNDSDFHVALHVIFDSPESHDAYQVAPRHMTFIEENKANWAKVRVFDSQI